MATISVECGGCGCVSEHEAVRVSDDAWEEDWLEPVEEDPECPECGEALYDSGVSVDEREDFHVDG